MYLSVNALSKAYGANIVLNEVSFELSARKRMGLVGANGVGKSTLLKIIAGEIEPDRGTVWIAQGVEVGYLPQVLSQVTDQTIDELILASQGELKSLEAHMRKLERFMAESAHDFETVLSEYNKASERFERRGGYDLDYRINGVFSGLGIAHLSRDRLVSSLSGGEKARLGLAALLLLAPDLLLLDEPTNHLDFAALAWLESHLSAYSGALLIVSHDRQFLNQTVDSILEIAEHSREAIHYAGNYDFYAEVKALERQKWIESYWAQQEEIWELRRAIKGKARQVAHHRKPKDNEKFAYTAKGEKVQQQIARNVHQAEERLRRIEADPIPKPPQELNINPTFDPKSLTSRAPLVLSQVSKAYGNHEVLSDINLSLSSTSRIVILGPNGAGKSTLFKIIVGEETPDTGEVFLAASVVVGYLDQEQETLGSGHTTVYKAYRAGQLGHWEDLKAEMLRCGLFVYDDLHKPVHTLSVGQKRKLQIARLMAQHANLLLLDEPTNHISLDILEEFEQALLRFSGPILAISHDRRFIKRFADEVWELNAGRLREIPGGWEAFC